MFKTTIRPTCAFLLSNNLIQVELFTGQLCQWTFCHSLLCILLCTSQCVNVYSFLNHCPTKGPLAHTVMPCLSKTIWVTARQTDTVQLCSENYAELWCYVYRELGGEWLKVWKVWVIQSQRVKSCMGWTREVLQHCKAEGKWGEGWERTLAVTTIFFL